MFMTDIIVKEKNDDIKVDSPRDVIPLLYEFYKDKNDKEYTSIVCLNASHKVISIELISIGTLNRAFVEPRDIFRKAILSNCLDFIFVHNHPSGNVAPSDDDVKASKKLKEIGEIIGIQVLDSIIIGDFNYYSFKEENLFF